MRFPPAEYMLLGSDNEKIICEGGDGKIVVRGNNNTLAADGYAVTIEGHDNTVTNAKQLSICGDRNTSVGAKQIHTVTGKDNTIDAVVHICCDIPKKDAAP